MSRRSFILLMLVCLLWAGNMIVSRLVVADFGFPPLWFNLLRSVILALVMLPWLFPVPRELVRVVLVTFAMSGGGVSLVYIGLQDATASAASIVSLSSAPLTVIFAVIFLGEVVKWRRVVGIALTFVGVIVAIASPSDMEASVGLLIIFAAALCGALGAVFLKRLDVSALRLQAWAGASSAFFLLPLSLIFESGQVEAMRSAGWPLIASLVYAALGVSVLAHTLYYRILQSHDANVVAPLTLVTPLFTIAGAAFLTGESVGWPLLLGGAIASLGVLVILLRPGSPLLKAFMIRPRV